MIGFLHGENLVSTLLVVKTLGIWLKWGKKEIEKARKEKQNIFL